MAHLDPERFEVIPVGITKDGTWTVGVSDAQTLSAHGRELPEVRFEREVSLSVDPSRRGVLRYENGELYATADVIFPVLHGRFGEDGTIQGLFELSGVPYVGPGVVASAAGMDKEVAKKLMVAEQLPTGKEVILRDRTELTHEEQEELGLPVFVKPARGGSSIGISKVSSWQELTGAVELARQYDSKVIVEAELVGAEIECGVLQYPDGRVVASVPAQLRGTESGDEGFYGFDTKYLDNVVSADIPAPIGEEATRQIQEIAVATFKALECDGLSRVDFFLTERGPVLNEINTMPGFTAISMYPQVFAASGVEYSELLSLLVERALARFGVA